jgi:hypothetical protein
MQPVYGLVESLSNATMDLQRRIAPFAGDVTLAWAVLASGAASACAMKYIRLSQPQEVPRRTVDRAAREDTRRGLADLTVASGHSSVAPQAGDASTVQVWRSNTQERLAAVAAQIRDDERLRPIVEVITLLLAGVSFEAQWQASKAVETLEFMQQARNAHHALNFRRIWP